MSKKLFSNYNFQFDNNEKKLIINFCKQVLKQTQGSSKFYAEERAFNSIITKLNEGSEEIRLTKDEKTRLTHQLQQNIDHLKKNMDKSWFIKKWLYKSMYNQYTSLMQNHFKD